MTTVVRYKFEKCGVDFKKHYFVSLQEPIIFRRISPIKFFILHCHQKNRSDVNIPLTLSQHKLRESGDNRVRVARLYVKLASCENFGAYDF